MRINGSGVYKALLIPDASVGTDQNERFVLVAGADGVVQSKRVQLGRLFGDLRAIESGLAPADRVVVNGLQMARPGAKASVIEGAIPEPSAEVLGGVAQPSAAGAAPKGRQP